MDLDRNDALLQTTAHEEYYHLVLDIIRDKESMGSHDYYSEYNRTTLDLLLARLYNKKGMLIETCKNNRGLIEKLLKNIECSKKHPGEKDFRKASARDIEKWNTECMTLQQDYIDFKGSLEKIIPLIEDIEFNRYLERGQRNTMKYLRDKFFNDGNVEYLEKGITWAVEYETRHRVKVDYKSAFLTKLLK